VLARSTCRSTYPIMACAYQRFINHTLQIHIGSTSDILLPFETGLEYG